MDKNIDDIFYKGLDGKSIEKPDSYWDEMSSNVLKNSFLRPWWKTTTAYVSASILVVVTTVVVWISLDGQSTGKKEMQPDPAKEEMILDSLKSSEQSNKNAQEVSKDGSIQRDFSETENQKTEDKAATEKQVREFKKALQPAVNNEREEVKIDGQNSVEVISEEDIEENEVNDSIQTVDEAPVDTLEQIKVPDRSETVEEEKKPVVIIVQDTIVVTDTVKTGKKR